MKVLVISNLYEPYVFGGAEKVAQMLAELLVQAGHAVTVISSSPERGRRVVERNGVKVHYVGLRNIYWPYGVQQVVPNWKKAVWHAVNSHNPAMAAVVGEIATHEAPDVVNTHNLTGFSPAVWHRVARLGLPICHTLHDHGLLCMKGVMYRDGENCTGQCGSCRVVAWPARWGSRHVKHVVGVSRFILDRHLRAGYFPEAREAVVIHNAQRTPPAAGPRVDSAGPRFGYLGSLVPGKGVEWLLDSFAHIEVPSARLVIAGRGAPDYVSFLRTRYAGDPRVSFTGFVEPATAFSRMDVLVAPSLWHDALPTVVYEAYAHGLPVIVSDRGGLPEMVDPGRTGFVCAADKRDSLVEAMRRFIRDPDLFHAMREPALARIHGHAPGRFQAQYVRILEQAAGQRSMEPEQVGVGQGGVP